jgi:predicted phage terminase large subunit-like protein
MNNELAVKMARKNLLSYCYLKSPWFHAARHHIELAKLLMKVEAGEITRLILSAPPRHGKTTIIGEHFPAWFMGRNPDKKIIYSTYGQSLSSDIGQLVRDQIYSDEFEQVFEKIRLSKDSKSKNKFHITKNNQRTRGQYIAVGRGGAVTGKGGHLIVVDDILKDYKESMSEAVRKECIDYWKNTLSTRMEKDAAVIIMATRWHEEDLIGYLLKEEKNENWVVVNFPALDENENALWPEMYSKDYLLKQKKRLGREFDAQYQGSPTAKEGNLFKSAWMKNTYDSSELFTKRDLMIQYWDTTFKEDGTSYVVGQCWQKKGNQFFIRDQVRGKWGFSKTCEEILKFYQKWPDCYKCYIENKANGEAIVDNFKKGAMFQRFNKNPVPGIIAHKVGSRSKEERADSVTMYWQTGNVRLPEKADWKKGFVDEHLSFPVAANDDQVDVSTAAISILAEVKKSFYEVGRALQSY